MSKRILIVEDDDVSRELARRILNRAGFTCIETANGSDVIRIAVQEQPDVILMDYHLPGVEGIELTRHLTRTAATRHIPVIALTADIYVRQQFLQAGAAYYLVKPLGKRSLLRAIETVTQQRLLA